MAQRETKLRRKAQLSDITIKSEWICDNCKILHTIDQLVCIACNKAKPITNLSTTQKQAKIENNEKYKQTKRGLIQCNGDCGSQLSELLENIVNDQDGNIDSRIISLRFRYYDDPLRQTLLKLMRRKALFEQLEYKEYYDELSDKEYYVKGATQVQFVIDLFKTLARDDHIDILQRIAHQTCKDPSWSLLEQISYAKLYELQDNYNSLKNTISMFENDINQDDNKQNQIALLNALRSKGKTMEEQIEKEKENVKEQKNLKSFLDKLNTIKTKEEYIQMQKQNAQLNDLEILAVLLYTDVDYYCNKMRSSHRNKEENSCKYSNLFFHLCSAVDKMWRVFHKNKKNKPQFMFNGSTISYLSVDSQSKLHLKTCTSFTTSYNTAKEFANKIKYNPTDKLGMILVIDNANEGLCSGRVKGADVSWISKHRGENEYLILPTTFSNFRKVSEQERQDKEWYISLADHNMYITNNTEAMNMTLVTSDIYDKLDCPMSWIPSHIKEYSDLKTVFDKGLSTIGALLGHFRWIECFECKIVSRIMDYTGKWSDLSIQCPSCRTLLFGSNNTDDRNRIIDCFNADCPVKCITRLELENVDEKSEDGYKCVHCEKQQKITHLNNLACDNETIEQTADRLLDDVQTLLKLNAKYTDGDEKEAAIDKGIYKADLMAIISFLNKPQNVNKSLFDIIKEFPVIWKWITSIKYVKLILDAYKDGYTKLLNEGYVETKNDEEISKNLKLFSIVSTVQQGIDIVTETLNQFTNQNVIENKIDIESDNESDEESDEESNRMVYYNCPQCSKRVSVFEGVPQVTCATCIQKNIFGFSLF